MLYGINRFYPIREHCNVFALERILTFSNIQGERKEKKKRLDRELQVPVHNSYES